MRNPFTSLFISASVFILNSISYAEEPAQSRPATPIAPASCKPDSPKEAIIRVEVTGDVVKPGFQEFAEKDKMTVSKAIAAAGGFTDFAHQKKVKLIRKGADEKRDVTIIMFRTS